MHAPAGANDAHLGKETEACDVLSSALTAYRISFSLTINVPATLKHAALT